jgi:hypothetical protein
MESVRASVIVINYNYERFLRSAIESALSQTYKNCEVIVVDDGSTDGSRGTIERFGRQIVTIFKDNGGQGSALNAGFEASSGDLIVFLDADDMLSAWAVETIVRGMGDGVALIRYPFEMVNAEGESLGRLSGAGGARLPSAYRGPFGVDSPGGAKAFPRAILKRLMPVSEKDWRMGADALLAMLSTVLGKVVCLDETLGKYRIHGTNHVAGVDEGLTGIRRNIGGTFMLYSALHKLTYGELKPLQSWLDSYPQHWVDRIRSLRESPRDHPLSDRLPDLTLRALSATWRHPYWNRRRKAAYSLWILFCSTAPCWIRRQFNGLERAHMSDVARHLMG